MKKLLAVIAALFIASSAFAGKFGTYVTGNYDIDGSFYSSNSESASMFSQGGNLSVHWYFLGNLGVYANLGFNSPVGGKIDDVKILTDGLFVDGLFGLTYKYDMSKHFQLLFSGGFHFTSFNPNRSLDQSYSSFGFGGDIGVRYLPVKFLYLTGGLMASFDPAFKSNTSSVSYKVPESNYFGIRPYVGIGFLIYEKK